MQFIKRYSLIIGIAAMVLAAVVSIAAGSIVSAQMNPPKAAGGVTATATAQGVFGSDIVVQVTCDANNIYAVEVLEQSETPELGGKACEELPAAMVEANSINVDAMAGATVTSEALKTAVADAIRAAGFNPDAFGSGVTVTATVQGVFGSDIVVEVTCDENTIYSIVVLQQEETPELGGKACEELPALMVEANSITVDSMSGATVTSEALKSAVIEAIQTAGFDSAVFGG